MAHERASTTPLAALVLATTLLAGPAVASADDGGFFGGIGFGVGSADFEGYPDSESGFGFNLDLDMIIAADGVGLIGGVLAHYFRTADGAGEGRVVTIGNFYGVAGGVAAGGDGFFAFGRGGLGFATRSVDDVPDGNADTHITDRGTAAMAGLGLILGAGEGMGFALLGDYVVQFGGAGMSYFMISLAVGVFGGG